ncbi:hypothetical protein EDD15DRAFT_2196368 [Pisolithus albus]|nr:hypothetical protein EDD15DRAFT_2196368 [Pisolithus albus]
MTCWPSWLPQSTWTLWRWMRVRAVKMEVMSDTVVSHDESLVKGKRIKKDKAKIGIVEEQPLPTSAIEWWLQVEAQNNYEDWDGPSSQLMQPALTNMHEVHPAPENLHIHPYISEIPKLGPMVNVDIPLPSFPPESNYYPSTLVSTRFLNPSNPCVSPYNAIHLGETALNEAFVILRQAVIWVGQATQNIIQDLSGSQLPPAHVASNAGSRFTVILSPQEISIITTNAQSNLKQLPFSQTILPSTEELGAMIIWVLQNAVLDFDQDGVREWV